MTPQDDVRDRYHGHLFEVVIPCLTLEEANAEKADLHAAVEARAFVRPAGAGGVLDRDQAWRDAIQYRYRKGAAYTDEWMLDRLAAAVRPATIDRDALVAAIKTFPCAMSAEDAADRLITLALVRPAAIDRDALVSGIRNVRLDAIAALVEEFEAPHSAVTPAVFVDRVRGIMRAVRPVAGVTLTPEQVEWIADSADLLDDRGYIVRAAQLRQIAARAKAGHA